MARVQYGAMITALKGNVGGSTFQNGNSCKVLRNKGYKVGSSTQARQSANKQVFSQAQRWRTLADVDKQTWLGLVGTWIFYDKFGNAYNANSYQIFVAYNAALLSINEAVVNTPSSPVVSALLANPVIVYSLSGHFNLTVTATTGWQQQVQFFASRPLSPGINNNNAKLRFIDNMQTNSTNTQDMESPYTAIFGTPTVGSKIVVKLVVRVNSYPYAAITQIIPVIVTA
jgi:hypothetical protein